MDDVAIELVEAKLIKVLPDIFSPMTVFTMNPELVGRIAGESEEKLRRREELERQLDVLGKGSEFCKRFAGIKLVGKSSGHDSEFFQTRRANFAADVIVDGARLPESASASEAISEDAVASVDERLSDGAPASEVCTDFGVPQPHRSPERTASPDVVDRWIVRPDSPADLERPSPRLAPYIFRG